MAKKNVLLVAYNGMGKSGVPTLMMEILRSLHNDYSFSLVVFESIQNDFYYDEIKQLNIPVYVVETPKPISPISRFYNQYIGIHNFLYKYFLEFFKTHKFDIVHSFKEGDSSGIFKAAKKCGIENRIWYTTVLHCPEKGIERIIQKNKLRLTNKYTTVRAGVSKKSCKLAFTKKYYTVINNCYAEKTFKYSDYLGDDNINLLQIGYLSPNKNQLFSIKVLEELIKLGRNCTLSFITNENEYKNLLTEEINNHNLGEFVHFYPSDYNQPELYKKTNYFLLPSIKEGFGIVLIEAQASGVSCIVSTSVPEEPNAGGVHYVDLDPILWANKINSLYSQDNGIHHKFDVSKYSINSFINANKDLYQK